MTTVFAKAARFVRAEERPATDLESDLVFLDAEHGEYQVLRGTARRVWDLLERPSTLEELCSALQAEYAVPPSVCRAELSSFLAELTRIRVVRVESP